MVLIDVGGGSTEIVYGRVPRSPTPARSKLGSLRMTRSFLRRWAVTPAAVEGMSHLRPGVSSPLVHEAAGASAVAVAQLGHRRTPGGHGPRRGEDDSGSGPPQSLNAAVLTRTALAASRSARQRRARRSVGPCRNGRGELTSCSAAPGAGADLRRARHRQALVIGVRPCEGVLSTGCTASQRVAAPPVGSAPGLGRTPDGALRRRPPSTRTRSPPSPCSSPDRAGDRLGLDGDDVELLRRPCSPTSGCSSATRVTSTAT